MIISRINSALTRQKYEVENAYTESPIKVITDPEEYDGQELAYCISDARFYEPERELTDEEMLQLIDLEHKNQYIFEKDRPGDRVRKTGRMATDISFAIEKILDNRDHMLWSNYRLQHVVSIVKYLFYCK